MYNGIGASAGIGIGRAVLVRLPDLDYSHVVFQGAQAEKARVAAAAAAFTAWTSAMAEAMRDRVGEKQAEILLGQIMMLGDPFMTSQMNDFIDQGACAEGALDAVCGMYIDMFSSVEDELTRQRATDVRDLRDRMLAQLLGQAELDLSALPPSAVLVARDLTPSMTAGLKKGAVAGIVTEVGGTTSHSAILARAMELPAVLSVENATALIKEGDSVVVDGGEGQVLVSPGEDILRDYRARREALLAQRADLDLYRGRPTRTADGRAVRLCGNIGSAKDARAVMEATGEGVGLFRTEFLFMDRASLPDEEEQFEAYRAAAEALEGRELIIRTLDVGGDKDIPYLGLEREENPFLGYRAIRYCLGRQDVFAAQLRALLRASAYGDIKIMLPLVTCADELRQAKALLTRLKGELDAEGLPYNREIRVGVMIETPAASLIADLLAREADFFSIGTNDLTQYTMAADRGNAKVSYLGSPYNPAVLRSIRHIIRCGHEAGIPVGMCGEAAADPLMLPLLLSFGLDEFSVGASAILPTRKLLSKWSAEEAGRLTAEVMELSSADGIRAYLKANVHQ